MQLPESARRLIESGLRDESTKALLHERLGGERLEAGFAEGAEMGIERTIEFALQTTD